MNRTYTGKCHFCPTPIQKGFICKDCRQRMRTPKWLVRFLELKFAPNGFDLDVAASAENAVGKLYYDEKANGLVGHWHGNVFCNPPFSEAGKWVEKTLLEWGRWKSGYSATLVLPVGCSQQWYHRGVLGSTHATVWHPDMRINFDYPDGSPSDRADRDTMIVTYSRITGEGAKVRTLPVREFKKAA